jgi:hypothetical protein
MSDKSPGGILASDILGLTALNAAWRSQNTNNDDQAARAIAQGNDGDQVASTLYDDKNEVSGNYTWVSADPIWTDTSAENLLPIGTVAGAGSYMCQQEVVSYSNNAYPTLAATGHNHDDNPHADTEMVEYSPSIVLAGGFGVPDILANADTDSSPTAATYTLTAEHQDVNDKDGNHLAGDNYNGSESLSLTYYGSPSLTTTGWDITSANSGDANADFDTYVIALEKGLTRDA